MNQIDLRTPMAALLVCALAAPAWADAAADVQTKIDGALKSAKSFAVTTRYPAQEYSSTLVHVAPDRSRVVVAVSANTTDVVTIGNTSYSSKNGTPFERALVSAEAGAQLKSLVSVKVGAILADVTIAGKTYGAFDTTVPLGGPVRLTCTYDKKTFRLARCANDEVTQTYANYDDPDNVVDPPKDSVDAPRGEQ
jgi:hypothetical protein